MAYIWPSKYITYVYTSTGRIGGCSLVGLCGSEDGGIGSIPSVCCFAKLINTYIKPNKYDVN